MVLALMALARRVFCLFDSGGESENWNRLELQTREMATEVEAWTTIPQQDGQMFSFF